MSDTFDISFIIATYNRRDTLRRTLKLYNFQKRIEGRFEVLVVDDGSADETEKMVEALRLELNYPLWFSRLPANSGSSVARNTAMNRASGRIMFFSGDDILPREDLLLEHYEWHTNKFPSEILVCLDWCGGRTN